MLISVIIASYNKPYHLSRVLCGYELQSDTNFEVVVAEDGTDHRVAEVVGHYKARNRFHLQHHWQEDRGFRKTIALNRALELARGKYVIFTDDDCLPAPNLVASHRNYSKPGQYIVGSYNRLTQRVTNAITIEAIRDRRPFSFIWLVANGYHSPRGTLRLICPAQIGWFLDKRGSVDAGRFTGGNSSLFLEDVVLVGGFNERITYGLDDREFGTRLHHAGIRSKRMKHSSYVLHLEHERDYVDLAERAKNMDILQETKEKKRIKPDD